MMLWGEQRCSLGIWDPLPSTHVAKKYVFFCSSSVIHHEKGKETPLCPQSHTARAALNHTKRASGWESKEKNCIKERNQVKNPSVHHKYQRRVRAGGMAERIEAAAKRGRR